MPQGSSAVRPTNGLYLYLFKYSISGSSFAAAGSDIIHLLDAVHEMCLLNNWYIVCTFFRSFINMSHCCVFKITEHMSI